MNSNNVQDITIIAISGGSGSGKTTLATQLENHYGENACLISLDSYYKDLSHLSEIERSKINFDHPDCLDFELFRDNVKSLINGNIACIPSYSFETHCRLDNTVNIKPKPILILEGLYAFFDKEISDLVNIKVFVEVSDDLRLIRRIRRDVIERGRDVESVLIQYESTVRKMYSLFIHKQKKIADLVVDNNGDISIETNVDLLMHKINTTTSFDFKLQVK